MNNPLRILRTLDRHLPEIRELFQVAQPKVLEMARSLESPP